MIVKRFDEETSALKVSTLIFNIDNMSEGDIIFVEKPDTFYWGFILEITPTVLSIAVWTKRTISKVYIEIEEVASKAISIWTFSPLDLKEAIFGPSEMDFPYDEAE